MRVLIWHVHGDHTYHAHRAPTQLQGTGDLAAMDSIVPSDQASNEPGTGQTSQMATALGRRQNSPLN